MMQMEILWFGDADFDTADFRSGVVEIVPEQYYDFIMQYAPYLYVIPDSGPDLTWGKAALAGAFAVDFLFEAYSKVQFEDRKAEILSKIVTLSDWLLTQQCTDKARLAYGGFKSNENSTYYYSIDACRVIPSLLRAHEITGNAAYLESAVLAGSSFLYSMQHKPCEVGIHERYYGGFSRAVTTADAWLREMDVECLYGLIGLKLLCASDPENEGKYSEMANDATISLREGLDKFCLYFDPLPNGDGCWHRTGLNENMIFDDSIAYALLGLFEQEGFSSTVQKVYHFINTIRADAQHSAYNPSTCWAGYIDVVTRFPACDYYDAVTAGILWKIRSGYDKVSMKFTKDILDKHRSEFMFWGVKHADYGSVEDKKAMATVCWLSQFCNNYEEPLTRFVQILRSRGENLTLYPIRQSIDTISYGEQLDFKAIVAPTRIDNVLLEPGYMISDYIILYTFTPLRSHDKVHRRGLYYEVESIQSFDFQNETAYLRVVCRRMIAQ